MKLSERKAEIERLKLSIEIKESNIEVFRNKILELKKKIKN